MRRYICLMLFLGLAFSLIINTQVFAAGKTLYDDFSSNYIDGSKWTQRTYALEVVNGQYVSKLGNRTPGMSAEIAPGIFRNNLRFTNPGTINSIECEITVVETKLDSASGSISSARVGGFFYNINETGGVTGDIFAQIRIGDRGNGGLEAFWEVQEMLSDDTSTWDIYGTGIDVLGTGTIIAPGTLNYNTPYKVKISYDGDRSFSFAVNEINDSFIGPTKKRVAVFSSRVISSAIDVANGSNNGYVFAKFDNVYINDQETVYDDFSTSPLDQTKWSADEVVAEIANGKLRLNRQGFNNQSQVTVVLIDYDTPYLEAKVRIESDSQLPPGTTGIARIQGFYYNDSRGPGSGQDYNRYEDDVFVQVRLQLDGNGNLKARAWVDKSEDANQTIWTTLFDQFFNTPIQFDTDYVLSIEYTNSQLIFKCNDEKFSYAITTPEYSPFGEHRSLRSRVYLDPGESGYIKAQFDDVYVETEQSEPMPSKAMPWIPLLLLDE